MPRLVLTGKVIRKSGRKSIVVAVSSRFVFPMYGKTVKRTRKYHVHDENEVQNIGDVVKIVESRPISRLKRWTIWSADSRNGSQGSAQDKGI